jgi:lipid-A-disaccharide synthase
MKIFVSAAEISSDLQAEKIIRSFLSLLPENSVEIYGIGGPRLRSLPGFRALKNAEDLRAMGFVEVLSKLKVIRAVLSNVMEVLESNPPDLVITFDYPDFHFELMKRIHANPVFDRTLKICGIPPKVWVWRSHRVEKIRRYYDGVWVIFPFEKKFYEGHGIPVIYQGNPLISDLLEASKDFSKMQDEKHISIAVMPGSREAELTYHLPVIQAALNEIAKKTGKLILASVPVPEGLPVERVQKLLVSSLEVQYRFVSNGSIEILSRHSLGLIKSGTSTLEAAVLGCVPIIFYKANLISEWIFRLVVKYGGPVGLPNILLNIKKRENAVFPELLGPEATAESLSSTFLSIYQNPERLRFLQAQGESLRSELVPKKEVPLEVAK